MKHQTRKPDLRISSALEKEAVNKTITCNQVHDVAKALGISPKDAGIQADLMELRLKQCCLGLFGYEPDGKNLDKNIEVSEKLSVAIKKIAHNGTTTCIQCWKLTSELGMKHLETGSSCEKLGIKIKKCQIGAF
ncbi:MAG: hypothetical protein HQK61_08290 [Desulfamplus sp.]|nr:hypothetical protein [Desulfamplus sp.]